MKMLLGLRKKRKKDMPNARLPQTCADGTKKREKRKKQGEDRKSGQRNDRESG
jgi:hypothetical protein